MKRCGTPIWGAEIARPNPWVCRNAAKVAWSRRWSSPKLGLAKSTTGAETCRSRGSPSRRICAAWVSVETSWSVFIASGLLLQYCINRDGESSRHCSSQHFARDISPGEYQHNPLALEVSASLPGGSKGRCTGGLDQDMS